MKKKILSVLVIGAMLSSCTNNGNKASTTAAKEVVVSYSEMAEDYNLISDESHVNWRASHLGGVQPRYGKIALKSAKVIVSNLTLTNASILIDMSAISVESFPEGADEIAKLQGHLQSPDFFNVAQYSTSKFELTSVLDVEGDYTSLLTGNLTILEVTKSITFNANVSIENGSVSVKSEDFSIDRRDWGLSYNTEGTAGVPVDYLIANDIGFTIDITLTK